MRFHVSGEFACLLLVSHVIVSISAFEKKFSVCVCERDKTDAIHSDRVVFKV